MNTWAAINAAASDQFCQETAAHRGIRPDFFLWLRDHGLFGSFQGQPAFPVHDGAGQPAGVHHRLPAKDGEKSGWNYTWFDPKGEHRTSPLILGDLNEASQVLIFESQWDAFAVLSEVRWHHMGGAHQAMAAIVTRGAQNGKFVRGLLRPSHRVLAFPQNDPVKTPGEPTPAEKWLNTVAANAGTTVLVVKTPEGIKDPNDWLKADGNVADLVQAMKQAVPVPPVTAPPNDLATDSSKLVEAVLGDVQQDRVSEAFPTDALPSPYREVIKSVANSARVPESLPGCLALAALSAATTGGLQGRLFRDLITPSNIYIIAGVKSGHGKSISYDPLLSPIHDLDRSRAEQWKRQHLPALQNRKALLEDDLDRLGKERRKLKDPAALADNELKQGQKRAEIEMLKEQSLEPRLVVEDITSQKLAIYLQQNQERGSLLSSDGGDVVNNLLGRYNKLDRADDSLLVKCYSGDHTSVDRVERPSVNLKRPLLSLALLVQPDKLETLMGNRQLMEGGFLARCLVTRIRTTLQYLSAEIPHIELKGQYDKAIQDLTSVYRLSRDVITVEATPAARKRLIDYFNVVLSRRLVAVTDMDTFAARHCEQACRIALLLHAARWGVEAGKHDIEEETVCAAIQLAEWFAREQLILLQGVQEAETARMLTGIERFASQHPAGFTIRDLQRMRIVEKAADGRRVLEALVTRGLANRSIEGTKTIYRLVAQHR